MAGIVALSGGLLVCGEAVLIGLGFVRTASQAARAAGLALVVGWAATGVVISLALAAAIPFAAWTVLAVWALLSLVSLAAVRWVPPRAAPEVQRERITVARAIALGGCAAVLVLMTAYLWRAAVPTGVLNPDVWNFWLPKAKSIHYFGRLDTGPGGFTSYDNADYPPLDPAFEATAFRFMGRADPTRLPLQHWVVAFGFVLALAFLLRGRVRPAVLWPALAVLAATPVFYQLVGSLLADEPLAILFALAGVCAALTVLDSDVRPAALGGLFLAGATLTKNEGLMLSLILVAVVAAGIWRARRPPPALVVLAVPPIAVAVAWKLWLIHHGVPPSNHYHFSDLFRPGFLAHRLDRLQLGLRRLLKQTFLPSRTLLLVPLAVALSALVARRRLALRLLAPVTVALVLLGYGAIYWISPIEIHFYLKAAPRIVTSIVLLCAALLPLLFSEASKA